MPKPTVDDKLTLITTDTKIHSDGMTRKFEEDVENFKDETETKSSYETDDGVIQN